MSNIKNHGITEKTPQNIFLGAGTIHNGLKYETYYKKVESGGANTLEVVADTETPTEGQIKLSVAQAKCKDTLAAGDFVTSFKDWNFLESLIGATSGGNKFSIKPNMITIPVDGAVVKTKGFEIKNGETAQLECNMLEITPEIIANSVIGTIKESDIEGYTLIESKGYIEADDYFTNFAYIGSRTDGKHIIIIFDNAICTSGFESENKNTDPSVIKTVIECVGDNTGDLQTLPYHIYYPDTPDAAA